MNRWGQHETEAAFFMLEARAYGPDVAWATAAVRQCESWTPHQRKRFAMWCALRMVQWGAMPDYNERLLRVIEACREDSHES